MLRHNLADFETLVVPAPIEDYTTSRILTMEYVAGTKITTLSPVVRSGLRAQARRGSSCIRRGAAGPRHGRPGGTAPGHRASEYPGRHGDARDRTDGGRGWTQAADRVDHVGQDPPEPRSDRRSAGPRLQSERVHPQERRRDHARPSGQERL